MDVLNYALSIDLPYPPSINHYYKYTGRGIVLGPKGVKYRHDAYYLLHKHKQYFKDKRLAVTINLHCPDKRKRDLDNVLKCILDSMQHAGVYDDDNQIDMLTIIRRPNIKGGLVQIWITECSLNE